MVMNLEQEKLGKLLIEEGVINEDQLEQALDFQENVGGKLGEILVKLDFATEEKLINVIARQQKMDTIDLSNMVLPEDLIKEIPKELIEKHEVIPVSQHGDTLQIAIHDPFDFESLEEVGLATNYHVEPALAPRASILKAINEVFYDEEEEEEAAGEEEEGEEEEAQINLSNLNTPTLLQGLIDLLVEKDVLTEEELQDIIREQEL